MPGKQTEGFEWSCANVTLRARAVSFVVLGTFQMWLQEILIACSDTDILPVTWQRITANY